MKIDTGILFACACGEVILVGLDDPAATADSISLEESRKRWWQARRPHEHLFRRVDWPFTEINLTHDRAVQTS